MLFEELDYWITKLCFPLCDGEICVIKQAKNYVRLSETPWKYIWTTLDFAYLEEKQVDAEIDQNDPFFVMGDFGGKFAVYGKCEIRESRITSYFGFKLTEDGKITTDEDKVYNDGSWLCATKKTKFRRLKPSEKRYLSDSRGGQ